jgi:uncharacterized protein YlxP (DUF503 family)
VTPAVALLILHLHIRDSQSLKDKRQVVRGLKDRLRQRFNVSVAELDFQDSWQRATVGVAVVSDQTRRAEELLRRVEAETARIVGDNLASADIELF